MCRKLYSRGMETRYIFKKIEVAAQRSELSVVVYRPRSFLKPYSIHNPSPQSCEVVAKYAIVI